MVRWDAVLGAQVAEHRRLLGVVTAHIAYRGSGSPKIGNAPAVHHDQKRCVFQQPARKNPCKAGRVLGIRATLTTPPRRRKRLRPSRAARRSVGVIGIAVAWPVMTGLGDVRPRKIS